MFKLRLRIVPLPFSYICSSIIVLITLFISLCLCLGMALICLSFSVLLGTIACLAPFVSLSTYLPLCVSLSSSLYCVPHSVFVHVLVQRRRHCSRRRRSNLFCHISWTPSTRLVSFARVSCELTQVETVFVKNDFWASIRFSSFKESEVKLQRWISGA